MTDKDPIEGFDIVDYDAETQKVTIQIDRRILAREDQKDAIVRKMIEAIQFGPSISGVNVEPRSDH